MSFFDGTYVDWLQEKACRGEVRMLARPAFRLATEAGWQELRDEIDSFFDILSPKSQAKLRRKRKDLENISQTVNEIKVGKYLHSLGTQLNTRIK